MSILERLYAERKSLRLSLQSRKARSEEELSSARARAGLLVEGRYHTVRRGLSLVEKNAGTVAQYNSCLFRLIFSSKREFLAALHERRRREGAKESRESSVLYGSHRRIELQIPPRPSTRSSTRPPRLLASLGIAVVLRRADDGELERLSRVGAVGVAPMVPVAGMRRL